MILEPTVENIRLAAAALQRGDLVGMPTETVYGIASNVFREDAIAKTFALKNRPNDNPLIVHIAEFASWEEIAIAFPDDAKRLAEIFWPGPLTFVLPKQSHVPRSATGGRETVAVRMPRSPVARALIREAGFPLTAPSANLFMSLSPTRAEDIASEVSAGLACILDGGPCEVGIESTVLDAIGGEIRLLRPGGIPRTVLEQAIGRPILKGDVAERRSPGMYDRHYAPKTPVSIVDRLEAEQPGLTFGLAAAGQMQMPDDPVAYAAELYRCLHALDRQNHPRLYVEVIPDDDAWEAVRDRLNRAI